MVKLQGKILLDCAWLPCGSRGSVTAKYYYWNKSCCFLHSCAVA